MFVLAWIIGVGAFAVQCAPDQKLAQPQLLLSTMIMLNLTLVGMFQTSKLFNRLFDFSRPSK